MSDPEIIKLQMLAAEQEKTIEELSGQVAEQWKAIEALQRKLDRLSERFLALEEQTAPDVPVTKVMWGTLPYVICMMLAIVILIFVPELATWLPDKVVTDAFKK